MAKTIVVLGVIDIQGDAVARQFVELGWNVRGVVPDKSMTAVRDLETRGVDLLEADLDQPESFAGLFKDAHVVFGIDKFWTMFFANYERLSQVSDRATGEFTAAAEIRRGKVLIEEVAKALQHGTLERFVFSTLPSMKENTGGKFDYGYHFESKNEVARYIEEFPELYRISSFITMSYYYTNLVDFAMMKPWKQSDGTFLLYQPGPVNAVHPFVYPPDIGKFVQLLVDVAPGKHLLGVSERHSFAEVMQIWSEETGASGRAVKCPIPFLETLVPGGLGREMSESVLMSAEFGWGPGLVEPRDLNASTQLGSYREYIKKTDWTSLLGSKLLEEGPAL